MKPKTIWLTGCSSGLGHALVDEFIALGHTVAACARREEKITELSQLFPEPHFFSAVDVADDEQVKHFCQQALQHTGPPDLLINNAAIINSSAALWEIPAKKFDSLTAININGTANMIRHTVPIMLEKSAGIIINISSGWGRSTSPEVAPYCASKWAIEGLTNALSQELPNGLAAIPLNPGVINTSMLQSCYGEDSSNYIDPTTWAKTAAPFILNIQTSQNGAQLTVPC